MSRRFKVSTAMCFAILVLSSEAMPAQAPVGPRQSATVKWAVADALGYGGLGLALGYIMAYGSGTTCPFRPCGGALMAIPAGAIAGMAGGAVIGSRAGRAVARGDELGFGQRGAVVIGAVMAGTTIGAIASFSMINGDGSGTPIGSDEKTFGLLVLGGTVLGTAFVVSQSHELNQHNVRISPTIGAGRYGVNARLSF